MTDSLIPYSFVPGTKARASEVNANFSAVAEAINSCNSSMSDLETEINTDLSNKLDLIMSNSHNITNCIICAPNGVATYSGATVTVKSGLKVLIPNGQNSDGSLKNIVYTLASDTSTSENTTNGKYYFALNSEGNLFTFAKSNYYRGNIAERPATLNNSEKFVYYALDTNKIYSSSGSTSANWTEKSICILGEYTVSSSNITEINAYDCINLTEAVNKDLSNMSMESTFNVLKPTNSSMLLKQSGKIA